MAKRFVTGEVDFSQRMDVVREVEDGEFLRHIIERIQICEDKVQIAWPACWERDNLFEAASISYASRIAVKFSKKNWTTVRKSGFYFG